MTDLPPIPGLNPALDSLPAKWHHLRPHQLTSVMDILDGFARAPVVVYDAPVGSGKTAVAEVVRLMLGGRGIYVCHNKDLQEQFLLDVPYAKLLQGRANYPVDHPFPDLTCADCTLATKDGEITRDCSLCDVKGACRYRVARAEAKAADLAVLNMSYWLNATRHHSFSGRDLVVVDEVDCLERVLLGEVEVSIGVRLQKDYKIDPPAKMTKQESHLAWADNAGRELTAVLKTMRGDLDVKAARRKEQLGLLVHNLSSMVADIGNGKPWVYCGGAGSERRHGEEIVFRPVEVSGYGRERIWAHGRKFLVMSGSGDLEPAAVDVAGLRRKARAGVDPVNIPSA